MKHFSHCQRTHIFVPSFRSPCSDYYFSPADKGNAKESDDKHLLHIKVWIFYRWLSILFSCQDRKYFIKPHVSEKAVRSKKTKLRIPHSLSPFCFPMIIEKRFLTIISIYSFTYSWMWNTDRDFVSNSPLF